MRITHTHRKAVESQPIWFDENKLVLSCNTCQKQKRWHLNPFAQRTALKATKENEIII